LWKRWKQENPKISDSELNKRQADVQAASQLEAARFIVKRYKNYTPFNCFGLYPNIAVNNFFF